jgi:hypothetical protein
VRSQLVNMENIQTIIDRIDTRDEAETRESVTTMLQALSPGKAAAEAAFQTFGEIEARKAAQLKETSDLPILRPAVWFSRHKPTAEQVVGAEELGFAIVAVDQGMTLGRQMIDTEEALNWMEDALVNLCSNHNTQVVMGVVPVPLRRVCGRIPEGIEFWESWNVNRAKEGEKPVFAHRDWVRTR